MYQDRDRETNNIRWEKDLSDKATFEGLELTRHLAGPVGKHASLDFVIVSSSPKLGIENT